MQRIGRPRLARGRCLRAVAGVRPGCKPSIAAKWGFPCAMAHSRSLLEHDLFGTPVSTFPDHALKRPDAFRIKFVLHSARQLAADMVDEIRQSVRGPSRILAAALLLPSYFPRLLGLLLLILPVDWPRGERGKAFRLAVGNLVLLRHDRPEQAWQWMERVLRTQSRSTEEYFLGAVCLYQGLGRMQEATALFARANERDFAQAQALGVARLPYRVLDEIWARHIGDAAILDYVIKLDALEGRPAQNIILYVPPGGRIGNPFLLRQLAQRVRLVERSDDLPFEPAAVGALHCHYQFPRQPDGSTVFF